MDTEKKRRGRPRKQKFFENSGMSYEGAINYALDKEVQSELDDTLAHKDEDELTDDERKYLKRKKEKKSYTLNVRFTESEMQDIIARCEQYGYKNKTEYIRDCVRARVDLTPDRTEISETNRLMKRIGANIDQILIRLHSTGTIYAEDISEIKRGVNEIWHYCCAMGVWYGYCHDRFLIELENGTQFTTKICDSKGFADDGEGKYHNFGGSGKCIVEFIYDDYNLPSCVAFSGSWGYYNWNGLDLGANIKSIKKINYGDPVEY